MAGPQQIVLIRHGEKPMGGKGGGSGAAGVNVHGEPDANCLIPRGWQRAGALAVLFAPAAGPLREPLTRPDRLHAPIYGSDHKTHDHRTYETILPLRHRLDLPIECEFPTDRGADLAAKIIGGDTGTSLVCWEHENIPLIAQAIPLAAGSPLVPPGWPNDTGGLPRFDVIWLFARAPGAAEASYTFAQLPQLLLAGDAP